MQDLKGAYDSIMKEVEQGREDWNVAMKDEVHQFCEYRANLRTREKLEKAIKVQVVLQVTHHSERKKTRQEREKKSFTAQITTRVLACIAITMRGSLMENHAPNGTFAKGVSMKQVRGNPILRRTSIVPKECD